MALLFAYLFVAVVAAGLSILFHYESLCFLERAVVRFGSGRKRLLLTMIGLIAAHIVEIWFYAFAFAILGWFPEFGSIASMTEESLSLIDLAYYSAMVYTTVGFGDMVPTGGYRLVTATEALLGLSLITWSASFTYFQMRAMFGEPADSAGPRAR